MVDLTHGLPSALRARARWQRLGNSGIPALLVSPAGAGDGPPPPVVLWMHGRTASKEIDPGRFLRLMRAGIGVCSLDLPGHGERYDASLQQPARTLDLVLRMRDEIDEVVDALRTLGEFDLKRAGIGGMSAGGMAALSRLCRTHRFRCVSVEGATGSWGHQRHREMFAGRDAETIARDDPLANLSGWRDIPFQAIHCRIDAWVVFDGQDEFVRAVRSRSPRPERIELVVYERTGAPFEHAGFGIHAADAKNRQAAFYKRWLLGAAAAESAVHEAAPATAEPPA